MKRLTALIANLGILFFAGNKGTFKTFDFPLYPIVIFSIVFLVGSLLTENKKMEKAAIILNFASVALYLFFRIVMYLR